MFLLLGAGVLEMEHNDDNRGYVGGEQGSFMVLVFFLRDGMRMMCMRGLRIDGWRMCKCCWLLDGKL